MTATCNALNFQGFSTTAAGTSTISNTALIANSVTFNDASDISKVLAFSLSGKNSATAVNIIFTGGGQNITFPTGNFTLPKLSANTYTGAQSVTPASLTSTSNHIATDASLSNIFTHTMTENTTLDNPTNLVSGTIYTWEFTQASSPKTLAFGNAFTWPGGTPLTISTANGAIDIITALYDGTKLRAVISGQAFA